MNAARARTAGRHAAAAQPPSIDVNGFCSGSLIVQQPQPRSVAAGSPASLTVSAPDATAYQWYVAGTTDTLLSGQTGSTLTAVVNATTTYFVRVTKGNCTMDSERVTVTLCTQPPVALAAPSAVAAGGTETASVAPVAGATYQWTLSGGSISGPANGSSVVFTAGCEGTTELTVTVNKECAITASRTVSITRSTAAVSGSQTIVAGSPANIRVDLTGKLSWR